MLMGEFMTRRAITICRLKVIIYNNSALGLIHAGG